MKFNNLFGIVLLSSLFAVISQAQVDNPNAQLKKIFKPSDATQCLSKQQCDDICQADATKDMQEPPAPAPDDQKDKKVVQPNPMPEPKPAPPKMPKPGLPPQTLRLDIEPPPAALPACLTKEQCMAKCPTK